MTASKSLMTAIAAATIVGTVGFVSAQTTPAAPVYAAPATAATTNAPGTPTDSQMAPAATGSNNMSAPPYVVPAEGMTADTGPSGAGTPGAAQMPAADAGATLPAESMPKADRN